MDNDKIKELYEQLKSDGYTLGDEATFRKDIQNDENFQRSIYDAQKADGYDMGGGFNAWQGRLRQSFGSGDKDIREDRGFRDIKDIKDLL